MEEINHRPHIEGGYDSSDPEQVNSKKRSRKRREHKNDAVLKRLLGTSDGRAWMWELLASAHCFTTSFTGEALSSAFKEGERNVGNALITQIMRVTPDSFILMMKEQNSE